MSTQNPAVPPDDAGKTPPADGRPATEQVNFAQASARVPEKIGRGVYSTAAVVLQGQHELAVDFLLRMVPPYQLAARVILPYGILGSVVGALQENWDGYRVRFGSPPTPPPPPPSATPPKISDVYDEMKLPEDVVVGAYANTLMITHTPAEFCFDFICNLFPRPVVTARVYMSALQVPGFLDTLKRSWAQIQTALQQQAQQQHLPPRPPAGEPKKPEEA